MTNRVGPRLSRSVRFGVMAAIIVAPLMSCGSAANAARATSTAQSDRSYDPDNRRDADLARLEREASDIQTRGGSQAESALLVVAAWQRLADAAASRKIDGLTHPLHGLALVKQASAIREQGDQPRSIALAKRGLDELAPFASSFIVTMAEGSALLSLSQSEAGRQDEAAATLEQATTAFDAFAASHPEEMHKRSTVVAKSNLEFAYSQILMRQGRNDAAGDWQRRSLATRSAGLGERDPDTVGSMISYAQILLKGGKPDEAERQARLAVTYALDGTPEGHPAHARALEMLGIVLSRTGRRIESVDYLTRALDIKRRTLGVDNLYFAYGVHNLATILVELDRFDDAEPLLIEADRGFRANQGEDSRFAAGSRGYLGQIHFARANPAAAVTALRAVLAQRSPGQRDDPAQVQRIYPALIMSELDLGDRTSALADARRYDAERLVVDTANETVAAQAATLIALAEPPDAARDARLGDAAAQLIAILENNQFLADDGALTFEQRISLDIVLRAAVTRGDAALGLRAMDLLSGSRIAQANRLVADRLSAEDAGLAGRLRAAQDATRDVAASDGALLTALAKDAVVNEKAVAAARAARTEAVTRLDAIRSSLQQDYPQWSSVRARARPTLAALRAGLSRNDVILGAVPAAEGTYLLAISRDGAALVKSTLGRAAVSEHVRRLRRSLLIQQFDAATSHNLYRAIFSDAIARITRGHDRLRFVASGALASIPLSILLELPTARPDRAAAWLFKTHATSVTPGFAALLDRTRATATREPRFLGVGSPLRQDGAVTTTEVTRASDYFRGGQRDRETLSALPPLPASATELRTVAATFDPDHSRILTGADATEAALRGDLSGYSMLMFATHGLVGGRTDGKEEAALVLSQPARSSFASAGDDDGLLTVSEIARMRLDADWVILSACNTAAGDRPDSAAYSGLAQAFIYAGTRALLLSHWQVRDDAAAFLTVETVRKARKGRDRATALRDAQRSLIADRSIPGSDDPAIWAPFVIVE